MTYLPFFQDLQEGPYSYHPHKGSSDLALSFLIPFWIRVCEYVMRTDSGSLDFVQFGCATNANIY